MQRKLRKKRFYLRRYRNNFKEEILVYNMRERGCNKVSSVGKFKNLLIFIAIIIIFGTIIFSSAQLRGEVLEESKAHNTKSIEAIEKRVFVEKMTKINKDSDIKANITTIQSGVVLNRPVYWRKNIKLSEPANLSIELPSTATNIFVVKLVIGNTTLNETEANITTTNETNIIVPKDVSKNISKKPNVIVNETRNITGINETISEEIDKKTKEEIKNKSEEKPEIEKEKQINKSEKKIMIGISGNIILRDTSDKTPVSRIVEWFKNILRLTGFVLIEDSGEENIVVEIDEIVGEVEIEYYTDAPYAVEEELRHKKFISIVGPENIHYENVLAFTELPKEVPENAVRLYWIVNESRVEIEFWGYNLNEQELNPSNHNYVNI